METGILTNIQHFSLEDGPGIRTVFFLKGCPFRCKWCGNPETQDFHQELGWSRSKCLGCGSCGQRLAAYGVTASTDGVTWHGAGTELPTRQEVERACPSKALHIIGQAYTVPELMDILKEQQPFLTDEGGVTLSGGEPLAQPCFALDILREAKKLGIGTAVETSSYASWEVVEAVAQETDCYMTDIKLMDREMHKKWTGLSNERVLVNIGRLLKERPGLQLRIRTPVIPGVNDTPQAIGAIGDFLRPYSSRGRLDWELLPYHRLGAPKYAALHRTYPLGQVDLSKERFQALREVAAAIFRYVV